MNLDRQAKGLRMIVDENGDLVGFPVIIVDPTGKKASVQGTVPGASWVADVEVHTAGTYVLHTPPAGLDSYVEGIYVDYSTSNLAAAGGTSIRWSPMTMGTRWEHHYLCPGVPTIRPSHVLPFGNHPIYFEEGVRVHTILDVLGNIFAGAWGYDA